MTTRVSQVASASLSQQQLHQYSTSLAQSPSAFAFGAEREAPVFSPPAKKPWPVGRKPPHSPCVLPLPSPCVATAFAAGPQPLPAVSTATRFFKTEPSPRGLCLKGAGQPGGDEPLAEGLPGVVQARRPDRLRCRANRGAAGEGDGGTGCCGVCLRAGRRGGDTMLCMLPALALVWRQIPLVPLSEFADDNCGSFDRPQAQ